MSNVSYHSATEGSLRNQTPLFEFLELERQSVQPDFSAVLLSDDSYFKNNLWFTYSGVMLKHVSPLAESRDKPNNSKFPFGQII